MTPGFDIPNQFPLNPDLDLEAHLQINRPSEIRRNITSYTIESMYYLDSTFPSHSMKPFSHDHKQIPANDCLQLSTKLNS